MLPPEVLARREPGPDDTARWIVQLKLRQRRLVTLKRNELPLVEDLVQPIAVPGCPPLFCLRSDVALLDDLTRDPPAPHHDRTRLIAPLDPLIYDRRVTSALWKFDYTWEVYTPPHKRVRGYYALPVMQDDRLLGHVDAKADRTLRRLNVVSRRVQAVPPLRRPCVTSRRFWGCGLGRRPDATAPRTLAGPEVVTAARIRRAAVGCRSCGLAPP